MVIILKRLFFLFTLISCLLIFLVYLGFDLYRVNLYIFTFTFIFLSFLEVPSRILKFFAKYELLLLFLIIFLATFILIRAGMFDKGIIAIQDYPIHYFTSSLMANKMLSQYHSVNGMYLNYQLGYSPLYDYPAGTPILITLLWNLSFRQIPFWMIFRFVVIISFLLSVFSVYCLSRFFGFHPFVSILSSLLWLTWFHEYFVDGTFISYYSLSFGLFSIAFFVKYLENKIRNNLLISGIFLALSLLFQSVFYPLFVFSLLVLALSKRKIREFFVILLISLSIGAVHFGNLLSWEYSFQIFSKIVNFFPHLYDINRSFWLHFYFLSAFPILISAPLIQIGFSPQTSWKINYLMLLSISFITISFLLNFLQTKIEFGLINVLANMFLIERVLFLDRAIFCILASLSVYYILYLTKKNNLLKVFVMSLLIAYVYTFLLYLLDTWYSSDSKLFEYIYEHKLKDWYSLEFNDGIFRNRPKKEVIELFEFLNRSTSKEARIIVEDSRYGKLGGNIMALISYFTDKYYVGGFYQGIFIEGDTWFVDGVIFGKNIQEYSEEELERYLEKYNVKWIAVWTFGSKNFFNNTKNFMKIYETSNGLFQVYEYVNLRPSYVYVESGKAETEILNDNKIIIHLFDVKEKEEIILKFRYEKYWHAYFDEREISLEKCDILMCLKAPKDGSYSIALIYKEGNLLKICKLISFLSLILCSLSLLGFPKKIKLNIDHRVK